MVITEFMQQNSILSLAIISFAVTFISTLITKWLTNQEHLKSLKERQKELQKELKNCKDECKMKEIQSEMLQITGTMMKSSFKPVFVTMIPFLILFYWLRMFFNPLMGSSWIWYYIGFSLVSNILYRKLFKMA